jgi:hypothetical protein
MHGTRLAPVVASVALLAGCATTPEAPALPPADLAAPPESEFASAAGPADAQRTLAYWNRVREVARRKPPEDLKAALAEFKRSAAEIRALPAVGVDHELLAHAEGVARHLDRFATLGQFVDGHPREARQAGMKQPLVEAWGRGGDATSRLKGLRAKLSSRYGIEFPPVETP